MSQFDKKEEALKGALAGKTMTPGEYDPSRYEIGMEGERKRESDKPSFGVPSQPGSQRIQHDIISRLNLDVRNSQDNMDRDRSQNMKAKHLREFLLKHTEFAEFLEVLEDYGVILIR